MGIYEESKKELENSINSILNQTFKNRVIDKFDATSSKSAALNVR